MLIESLPTSPEFLCLTFEDYRALVAQRIDGHIYISIHALGVRKYKTCNILFWIN